MIDSGSLSYVIKCGVTLVSDRPTVIFRIWANLQKLGTRLGDFRFFPSGLVRGKEPGIALDCMCKKEWMNTCICGWFWVHAYMSIHPMPKPDPSANLTPSCFYLERWEPLVQWFILPALENHDTLPTPEKDGTAICANLPPFTIILVRCRLFF